jgi:hypothetical protein
MASVDAAARRPPEISIGAPGGAAAVASLALAALVLFVPAILNDPDTYWHVAAGQWMLDHGRVPQVDVFSHTRAGAAWVPHEWLSEVLMALAWRAASWSGVLALYALAAGAAALMIVRRLSRDLDGVGFLIAGVLAFGCMAPSLVARPHLLVLPVLVGWVCLLLDARERGRAPPLPAALVMLLWANLHGSFVLGLALAAVFALEALIEAEDRPDVVRRWGAFGLLGAAAAAVTPNGVQGLIHPFAITSMSALPTITEWRPADFSKVTPFEIAILATAFIGLSRGVRVPALRLLLVLGLLHLALSHMRHQLVLAAVAPLVLAPHFANAGPRPARIGMSRSALALAVVAAAGLLAVRLALPLEQAAHRITPAAALAQVPAELRSQPVFNEYDFGGYLIFSGVRTFIDGRADMFGDAFTTRYMRAEAGDVAQLATLLRDHRVAWTLLRPESPAVRWLDAQPGWRRLHTDGQAVVHVRAQ